MNTSQHPIGISTWLCMEHSHTPISTSWSTFSAGHFFGRSVSSNVQDRCDFISNSTTQTREAPHSTHFLSSKFTQVNNLSASLNIYILGMLTNSFTDFGNCKAGHVYINNY